METKSGRQQEDQPRESVVIVLPLLAMCALIGIIALLMRSTGKW